jgi:hypothetical protein
MMSLISICDTNQKTALSTGEWITTAWESGAESKGTVHPLLVLSTDVILKRERLSGTRSHHVK